MRPAMPARGSEMRTIVLLLLSVCTTGIVHADGGGNFERRLPADPHGIVEISNVSGRVDVRGWDNPEVEVRAELGSGVDRVDVTSDHGRTTIKVIVPNMSFHSSISSNLHIRVPRDSELDFSGVSCDVISDDVQGALQLKTISGDVKADIFLKSVDVKTVSGDVTLRGHGQNTAIHIGTISGNVHVDRAAGDFEATTVSGDMTIRLEAAHSVRLRATSGDIQFEGKLAKGGSLDTETVSGDVGIRGKPESGLDYEVNTFSGDINDCMGVESVRVSKYGPGHRLTGSTGTDGARVRVKTMSGDVELCDKS
jgi:DUF4097 and DUF4098 domain-containing protein YvlB